MIGLLGTPEWIIAAYRDFDDVSERYGALAAASRTSGLAGPVEGWFNVDIRTSLPIGDEWAQTCHSSDGFVQFSGNCLVVAGGIEAAEGLVGRTTPLARQLWMDDAGALGRQGAHNTLIGLTDQEAGSLATALKRIEINGQSAIESVEAFGSRAGSTFRGRGPLPGSDLDIYVTVRSAAVNSPEALQQVIAEVNDISALFGQVKRFPVNPVVEIDAVAPAHRLQFKQTPFIRLNK